MAEEDITLDSDSISLEDTEDSEIADAGVSGIIPFIQERYDRAEDYRRNDEERWLRSYTNYRGIYGSDVQFTEAEKSRVFIKVTKTKTLAAYGQIVDVLFAGNKFPISIEPTILPEGVASDVNFDPKKPEQLKGETSLSSPYGFKGDGMDLPKGATEKTLAERLGPLQDKLEEIEDLEEGIGKTPTAITFGATTSTNGALPAAGQITVTAGSNVFSVQTTPFTVTIGTPSDGKCTATATTRARGVGDGEGGWGVDGTAR